MSPLKNRSSLVPRISSAAAEGRRSEGRRARSGGGGGTAASAPGTGWGRGTGERMLLRSVLVEDRMRQLGKVGVVLAA